MIYIHLIQDSLTAFHEAISGTSIKYIEFLLQFYDFDKCNNIKPLLDVLDPDYDGKNINYIKKRLGMEIKFTKTSIDALVTEHNKANCEYFLDELTALKNNLKENYPELLSKLPNYTDFLYEEKLGNLYNQFKENVALWKQYNNSPLQALYMEFGGAIT